VDASEGGTTETSRRESDDNRGDRVQNECAQKGVKQPVSAGVEQDSNPDTMPAQLLAEQRPTPLLEPIMEAFQLPRLRPARRRPRWLADYKLRRIARSRHSRQCSPTVRNCSNHTSVNVDVPEVDIVTLRCNMIRSEVHDMRRPKQCRSDSFDFAQRVFGDGVPRSRFPENAARHGARDDYRAPAFDRRHSEECRQAGFDRRYGLDVPFDRHTQVPPPMAERPLEDRPWGERLCRPLSPRFERGRRPFRGRGMARGWLYETGTSSETTTPTTGFAVPTAPVGRRGRDPYPYIALNRVELPRDPTPLPPDIPVPMDQRDPNRTYCPLCSRNYNQYRSCKRHCVLDHHRRYEHRYGRCVEFASEQEFREAWVKAKATQDSGPTRRERRAGIGSPPNRSAPPMMRQEPGRPLFRNSSTEGSTGGRDTRTVILQDKDDRRRGPPQPSQSETAITVSDDSDTATGKKKRVVQQMSSPPVATTADTRKVVLPPSTAEAKVPEDKAKGSDFRGTSMSPEAKARERERIRENWGMRFRTDEANSSLPRRGTGTPSFPRPWRGRGRAIPVTHAYSAEKVRAERLSHPDNIVNKCRLRKVKVTNPLVLLLLMNRCTPALNVAQVCRSM